MNFSSATRIAGPNGAASNPPLRTRKNGGFTLMEVLVASAIVAVGVTVSMPSLRGFWENSKTTGSAAQARALVTAVNIWRMKGGAAIPVTHADPMTVTRANAIYAFIDGQIGTTGEYIVEQGFQLPTTATFPTNWGEVSAGVFEPIP